MKLMTAWRFGNISSISFLRKIMVDAANFLGWDRSRSSFVLLGNLSNKALLVLGEHGLSEMYPQPFMEYREQVEGEDQNRRQSSSDEGDLGSNQRNLELRVAVLNLYNKLKAVMPSGAL